MSVISERLDPSINWNFAELREPIQAGPSNTDNSYSTIAAIAVGIVVAVAVGSIAATGGLSLPVILILATLGGAAGFAGYVAISHLVNRLKEYKQICMSAGMIDSSSAPHMRAWKDDSLQPTEMIPTEHCADTHEWRKKMIQAAEHNIVISGNYCGGLAFDEILDLIKKRMEEKPDLKVVIIGFPGFIKDETIRVIQEDGSVKKEAVRNKTKVAELQRLFPQRFSMVKSPNVWMVNGEIKKTTNHTKYFGIDWGKYYILGGSAIKDNFNQSGIDHPLEYIIGKDLCDQIPEVLEELSHAASLINEASKKGVSVLSRLDIPELSEKIEALTESIEETLRDLRLDDVQSKEMKIQVRQLINTLHLMKQFKASLDCLQGADHDLFIALTKEVKRLLKLYTHRAGEVEPETPSRQGCLMGPSLREFADHLSLFRASVMEQLFADSSSVRDSGLTGLMVPGNFRDMDFVFHSPEGDQSPGRRLFLQMLSLAYRWEQFNAQVEDDHTIPQYAPHEVPYFGCFIPQGERVDPAETFEDDTPLIRFMKEPMMPAEEVTTKLERFDRHHQEGTMKVLFSGPEQPSGTSDFAKAALEEINAAKEEIVINHMYFHPTPEIRNALIEAAKRGVKIKIITCGVHSTCPNGQKVFGPRNKYNYSYLVKHLPPEFRGNVEVYEYTQRKKGLHKKVIVFDGETVLAGSSNFGYKSLVTSSDHEVNFLAKSKDFAAETLKVCDVDIAHSRKIADPGKISFSEVRRAGFHRVLAPLVG